MPDLSTVKIQELPDLGGIPLETTDLVVTSVNGVAKKATIAEINTAFGTALTAGGIPTGIKLFRTVGNGSWTVPEGVSRIRVRMVGGGGGGSPGTVVNQTSWNYYMGGGGGAGAYIEAIVSTVGVTAVSFTIGAGGAAATIPASVAVPTTRTAGAGGNTTLTSGSTTLTANGGSGGVSRVYISSGAQTSYRTGGAGGTSPVIPVSAKGYGISGEAGESGSRITTLISGQYYEHGLTGETDGSGGVPGVTLLRSYGYGGNGGQSIFGSANSITKHWFNGLGTAGGQGYIIIEW